MRASKLQPALLGGLFIGVLSALPFISAGNLCCCLWVIAGGVLAAWLLQQNQSAPIEAGDGATTGLLAGIIGAGVFLVLSIPIGLLFGPLQADMMQRVLESAGDMPPEAQEALRNIQRDGGGFVGTVVGALIGFIVMLLAGVAFGALGGLLGALMFRKQGPPPAPPAPTDPFGPSTPSGPVVPPPLPPNPPAQ